MYMEENSNIKVIMRRPFLASSGALTEVLHRTITMRVKRDKVTICALPLTNLSPQIPIAKSSIRVPPIQY